MKRKIEHYYGCLLGGAIGDALGAPVEFMNYETIRAEYGEEGISGFVYRDQCKKAYITDDTQMTLFTAEGLLRSVTRAERKRISRNNKEVTTTVFRAYLRWLYTQGLRMPHWKKADYDGWLSKVQKLHAYREPGATCIATLGNGVMGTLSKPINDSKGCGGVMRVTPVGLIESIETVFDLGCETAAITHGHASGYLPAGVLALIIHLLIEGDDLETATYKGLKRLKEAPGHEECLEVLEKAIALAREGRPSYEKVESLGQGFMGHEALAIGIYAALSYSEDYDKAIGLAVNHSGDSDSTGAICGSILGAYLGIDSISEVWQQGIELQEEIRTIAEDLLTFYKEDSEWLEKYPAW